ncbi:MAG: hypothetical protein ACFFG0_08035 [Candidatus Thorarchaeota archaeon]
MTQEFKEQLTKLSDSNYINYINNVVKNKSLDQINSIILEGIKRILMKKSEREDLILVKLLNIMDMVLNKKHNEDLIKETMEFIEKITSEYEIHFIENELIDEEKNVRRFI